MKSEKSLTKTCRFYIVETWPERSFSVDEEAFSLSTAVVDGKLTGDGQGVAQLGFSRPELPKKFRDRTGLDPSVQQLHIQYRLGIAILFF